MDKMSGVRIGTCSWKYESWRGIVYPEDGEFDFLREYARHFDTVEVDQWFWSLGDRDQVMLPRPADVSRYRQAVLAGFRFSVKASNSVTLTHHYRKDKAAPLRANPHFLSPELYDDFLKSLQGLGEKLGLVMLQFEYLNKQKMAIQDEFLKKLDNFASRCPRHIPLAVELRNPAWLNEAYFTFLRDHGLHHVFCQGYYMPPVWEIDDTFGDRLTDTAIIRLMGRDRPGMEAKSGDHWDRVLEPKDNELEKIIAMVRRQVKRKKTVYINVNNHYEGSAPLTAGKIVALLRE